MNLVIAHKFPKRHLDSKAEQDLRFIKEVKKNLNAGILKGLDKYKVKKTGLKAKEILVKNGVITDYSEEDGVLIGQGYSFERRSGTGEELAVLAMLISVEN